MFRTEIGLKPTEYKFNYGDSMVTVGSCFSDSIGTRLKNSKFNTLVNPFGVIFNPISIFDVLTLALSSNNPDTNLYLQRDDRWLHHQFHSNLNGSSKTSLDKTLKNQLTQTKTEVNKAHTLVITFGSAFVYRHLETKQLVSNCHKVDSKDFQKELLSQKQIIDSFNHFIKLLPQKINIILTVSPVRHTRDGLSENMESKSILRSACGTLSRSFNNVHYFPSYEIMLDDLRDYRYYKRDLIHPTEEAEDYIFDQFIEWGLEPTSNALLNTIKEINRAINHNAFNPCSASHKRFISDTIIKMKELSDQFDFSSEIDKLELELNS